MTFLIETNQIPTKPGVYKISCLKSCKFYIGSAKNLNIRVKEHLNKLKRGDHPNAILQSSWDKYGENTFDISIIEECRHIKELLNVEQKYLDLYYDNQKICMNICPTAGSALGRKHTKETRNKISKAHTGKNVTGETKRKISAYAKNNTKAHFKPGKNNPMYGCIGSKHHNAKIVYQISPDTFEIVSEFSCIKDAATMFDTPQTYIGRAIRKKMKAAGFYWISDDNIQDFGANKQIYFEKKKRTLTEEHKKKLLDSRRDTHYSGFLGTHTEETKRKISLKKMPVEKKIVEIDSSGNVINEFECSFDVIRKYFFNNKSFSNVLMGKRKTIYGRRFEYR